MIARIWRGRTHREKLEEYDAYMWETGGRAALATPGNRGVFVFRRPIEGTVEWTFLSLWDSMDAIRAFAGPNPERAVYYPKDKEYLLSLDPHVEHHEITHAERLAPL
jgi:heme-degrading monooxygenase HmoA